MKKNILHRKLMSNFPKDFPDIKLVTSSGWTIAIDENLLVSKTVGYMLKVIKSGVSITKFEDEFNAIKHGDYDKFFNLIKNPHSYLLQGKLTEKGMDFKDGNFSQASGDCDMTMIIAVDNCLKSFYPNCFQEYNKIVDVDIPDPIFNRCAAFELSIRVHNNNCRAAKSILYDKQATYNLHNVIDELCLHKNINEIEELHSGRRFLNMIKHFKNQFPTWQDGISAFNEAWNICKKYGIEIGIPTKK